ncbi:MAG: methyltransferase domain-containing protein [Deltaproteobacteria bacterium]|nr:methyltransferase domain-containing protein [Deltaproteobacteria bacterium]
MNLKTFASLMKGSKILVLLRFKLMFSSFYRLNFFASMVDTVILERLARGPVTAESLLEDIGNDPSLRHAIESWLGLGVRLGMLKKSNKKYCLRGFLAKRLARPENDAIRALVREVASLHHFYIMQTPAKLARNDLWTASDQYNEHADFVARSSRNLEPFLFEFIDRFFPGSGSGRLLEVGCGHAGYIMYALGRNRDLSAIGLELDPQVAESARNAVRVRGLEDRVTILAQDVREFHAHEQFDILTLYNNIYYFPVEERVKLLKYLKHLLKPNGRIVITTGCVNGSIEFELVNLIHASTRGWGRLPDREEMLHQMFEAGFERNSAIDLLPGSKYYAFTGLRPEE